MLTTTVTDDDGHDFELSVDDQVAGSPLDEKWSEKAQEAELEALPTLRSTAEKWAATVGTLAGLFSTVAILTGPDELTKVADSVRVLVASLVLAAVLAAAAAVALASLAAQGGSESIVPTGPEYADLSAKEVQRARDLLAWSRWITVAILPLLGIAFLLAAINPVKESTNKSAMGTRPAVSLWVDVTGFEPVASAV